MTERNSNSTERLSIAFLMCACIKLWNLRLFLNFDFLVSSLLKKEKYFNFSVVAATLTVLAAIFSWTWKWQIQLSFSNIYLLDYIYVNTSATQIYSLKLSSKKYGRRHLIVMKYQIVHLTMPIFWFCNWWPWNIVSWY